MKKLLLLLSIIIPQLLIAQSESSIDLTAGINYSYRTISKSSDDFSTVIVDARKDREEAKSNWTFGVHYNNSISNVWHARTGLRLTSIGYVIFPIDEQQWPIQDGGSGQIDPNIPPPDDAKDILIDYLLLELPLLARLQPSTKKWAPFVEFGISPSYIINTKGGFGGPNPFLQKFQLAGIVSTGLNYTANSFQFFAQPTLRYHLTTTEEDTVIKEHLYSVGIELGFRKSLTKATK